MTTEKLTEQLDECETKIKSCIAFLDKNYDKRRSSAYIRTDQKLSYYVGYRDALKLFINV